MLRSFGQVHCSRLGFLSGTGHLNGGLVNGSYQFTQLVDGVVDRVGDRTGEVFGNSRGHRQVTVREVADFVEQSQNRGLVTLVLLGSFAQAATCFLNHDQANQNDRGQRQGAQHVSQNGVEITGIGTTLQALRQCRSLVEQGLGNFEDTVR